MLIAASIMYLLHVETIIFFHICTPELKSQVQLVHTSALVMHRNFYNKNMFEYMVLAQATALELWYIEKRGPYKAILVQLSRSTDTEH